MRRRDIRPGREYKMKDGSIKKVISINYSIYSDSYASSGGEYVNVVDIIKAKYPRATRSIIGFTHTCICEKCGAESVDYYSYNIKYFAKNALTIAD